MGYRKYSRVSPTAFGLSGGRKAIAVVRTAGAITGTSSGGASGGSSITSPAVIGQLRALKKDKVSRQWGWVWACKVGALPCASGCQVPCKCRCDWLQAQTAYLY